MKVEGRLNLLQSNLNLYIRLTGVGRFKTIDELRSFYYHSYLEDTKKALQSVVDEKGVGLIPGNQSIEIEDLGNTTSEIDAEAEDLSSTAVEVNIEEENQASGFVLEDGEPDGNYFSDESPADERSNKEGLNLFRSFISSIPAAPVVSEVVESSFEEDIHGVFLDDVSISEEVVDEVDIIDSDEEDVFEDIHGVYLDDIPNSEEFDELYVEEIEGIEEVKLDDIHGIFLEDIVVLNNKEDDLENSDSEDGNFSEYTNTLNQKLETIDFIEVRGTFIDDIIVVESQGDVYEESNGVISDDYLEDVEEDEVYDEYVEDVKEGSSEESFILTSPKSIDKEESKVIPFRGSDGEVPLEISTKDEPIQVPSTVREFLKKNPGASIAKVEEYYPDKQIKKELKLGKIYKKGNRLFI